MPNIVHLRTKKESSSWAHGGPKILSKPIDEFNMEIQWDHGTTNGFHGEATRVWWRFGDVFVDHQLAFLDVFPQISQHSTTNHLKRQQGTQHSPGSPGFPMSTGRVFFEVSPPQDIGTSPVYIAAQENHVEVPWSEWDFFVFSGRRRKESQCVNSISIHGKSCSKSCLVSCRWYKIRKGRFMKGSSRYML